MTGKLRKVRTVRISEVRKQTRSVELAKAGFGLLESSGMVPDIQCDCSIPAICAHQKTINQQQFDVLARAKEQRRDKTAFYATW